MQDTEKYINALKEILEISIKQKELLEQNRLGELLELQQKRDGLISGIKDYVLEAEARDIAKKILDNDSILMMKMMSSMEDIKTELKSTVGGRKAVKAYR